MSCGAEILIPTLWEADFDYAPLYYGSFASVVACAIILSSRRFSWFGFHLLSASSVLALGLAAVATTKSIGELPHRPYRPYDLSSLVTVFQICFLTAVAVILAAATVHFEATKRSLKRTKQSR